MNLIIGRYEKCVRVEKMTLNEATGDILELNGDLLDLMVRIGTACQSCGLCQAADQISRI